MQTTVSELITGRDQGRAEMQGAEVKLQDLEERLEEYIDYADENENDEDQGEEDQGEEEPPIPFTPIDEAIDHYHKHIPSASLKTWHDNLRSFAKHTTRAGHIVPFGSACTGTDEVLGVRRLVENVEDERPVA